MSETPYIQQFYAAEFAHCYGCGPSNTEGLHLKSYPIDDGSVTVCTFRPDEKYSGGYPRNVYGGMIAMLMDCHGTGSAAYFDLIHRHGCWGRDAVRRFVTARLEINYRHPTPMNTDLRIEARIDEVTERKVCMHLELWVDEVCTADGMMVAVAL